MKVYVLLFMSMYITNDINSQNSINIVEKLNETEANTFQLQGDLKALKDTVFYNHRLLREIDSLRNRLNANLEGNKKERVQLGLSFAYGEISDKDQKRYRLPTINPIDSTLRFQTLDGRFILVSTTMTITPLLYSEWLQTTRSSTGKRNSRYKTPKLIGLWLLENSGFSVNINFLQIATGTSQQSFNQIVEGGIGYSVRLNQNIYFSLTRELKFLNALNDSFKEGEPILYNNNKIASISALNTDDQNYFHNSTLLHWSMRVIVNF